MSIPKVIHYCWFGRGEKTELMKKCIASWKVYCPDYQIIEWNEDNFDPMFCPYAAKAYKKKRWGFLSDVARLKVVYENGGIYLDTDVELKNSIDELLDNGAWFGYGTETEINTGCGFGAEKGNWMVKKLLENYQSFSYCKRFSKFKPFEVCTILDTKVFKKYYRNYAANKNIRQNYNGVLIINNIWNYVTHYYTSTWMNARQRLTVKITTKLRGK